MILPKNSVICCKYSLGCPCFLVAIQLYSAVSTRSSILLLTNSKIRFSAVFFSARNCSVALSEISPPWLDCRASTRSTSSSWQAYSNCSRLMRICTICPRYLEPRRSTRAAQTTLHRSSSNDCRCDKCQYTSWLRGEVSGVIYVFEFLVDCALVCEVFIGEEVILVQEVTYVDTAQWIHLREW